MVVDRLGVLLGVILGDQVGGARRRGDKILGIVLQEEEEEYPRDNWIAVAEHGKPTSSLILAAGADADC